MFFSVGLQYVGHQVISFMFTFTLTSDSSPELILSGGGGDGGLAFSLAVSAG